MGKVEMKNYDNGFAEFVVTKIEDIACLPTTKKFGTGSASKFNMTVKSGSTCVCQENAKVYMLDGTSDTWELFKDHTK